MRCFKLFLFIIFLSALVSVSCRGPGQADLVLRNGKIATVDEEFSFAEAVAVHKERIVFVGKNEDVSSYTGPETRVIDLKGKLVLPGLIDSHAHIYNLGEQLTQLDITGTTSRSLSCTSSQKRSMPVPGSSRSST